jgi:pyruvate dehydrogenase E1 component alpha subunit
MVREILLSDGHAEEDDLKDMDREIKDIVSDAAEFAQTSPEPDPSELWTDILIDA